jgi:selenocysteine lyase/cysteine desulfurase
MGPPGERRHRGARVAGGSDTAELRTADLEALLGPRTRVVAFTHCSNIVGSINPVRQWTDLVHGAGARAIVDGVSFCPHGLPDVESLGADIYLFSLYKVYGPHLGAMYVRRDFASELPHQGHFFNAAKPEYRLTPAGADHAQVAAVNGVMDYLDPSRIGTGAATSPRRRAQARSGRYSAIMNRHCCNRSSISCRSIPGYA